MKKKKKKMNKNTHFFSNINCGTQKYYFGMVLNVDIMRLAKKEFG